jgi:hypothetical protein
MSCQFNHKYKQSDFLFPTSKYLDASSKEYKSATKLNHKFEVCFEGNFMDVHKLGVKAHRKFTKNVNEMIAEVKYQQLVDCPKCRNDYLHQSTLEIYNKMENRYKNLIQKAHVQFLFKNNNPFVIPRNMWILMDSEINLYSNRVSIAQTLLFFVFHFVVNLLISIYTHEEFPILARLMFLYLSWCITIRNIKSIMILPRIIYYSFLFRLCSFISNYEFTKKYFSWINLKVTSYAIELFMNNALWLTYRKYPSDNIQM